jgi:hypothetical protein
VRRTLSSFMGRGWVSLWARSAAADDMPAYSGGEGRESSAYAADPDPPTLQDGAF